jgi:guanylate kinase
MASEACVPARLIVLSGPSGVGRRSVVASLRRTCPRIWQSVPATTRSPRPGEAGRGEHIFVSDAEFDAMTSRGELLEWAQFGAGKYGTPRGPIARTLGRGVPAVVEMDIAGALELRRTAPGALLIFLVPQSRAVPARRPVGPQAAAAGEPQPPATGGQSAADQAWLAAGSDFDLTLVNASVEDVCSQLVALMAAQQAS